MTQTKTAKGNVKRTDPAAREGWKVFLGAVDLAKEGLHSLSDRGEKVIAARKRTLGSKSKAR